MHTQGVAWSVEFHELFRAEFTGLPLSVRMEIAASAQLLEAFGPQLGRPDVDTLNGSRYPNMKELRFRAADGVWRVAFAFDPARRAIILVAGDKAGVSQTRFYRRLIQIADARFASHLATLNVKGAS
jgi:hypothetical protein